MPFGTRNVYYLRVSASAVIPLYLYLDEQHVDWMSDRVLQHVLSDLRPLIPNKLIAEADAHLGPGGPANAKRGTLDVHRGDTYQFGYFLRNTDPHAVVIKTRKFTARPRAPKKPEAATPNPEGSSDVDPSVQGKKRKRSGGKTGKKSAHPGKKRSAKGKGKQRADPDSEAQAVESVGEDIESGGHEEPSDALDVPTRSLRRRKVAAGGYREASEDEEPVAEDDQHEDMQVDEVEPPIPEDSVPPEEQGPPAQLDDSALITMDDTEETPQPVVKTELPQPILSAQTPSPPEDSGPIVVDDEPQAEHVQPVQVADEPTPTTDEPEMALTSDDEDEKPKPIMSLKYQGFTIHGRCLCVIVEPYPPLRQERAMSLRPTGLTCPRAPSIAPADFVPSSAAKRARTPLFLPDPDERDRSVTPAPFQRHGRPPVPLWGDEPQENEVEDEGGDDGGMLAFSQVLQSVGGYGAEDDDDEIDGNVFLGDADEARGQ